MDYYLNTNPDIKLLEENIGISSLMLILEMIFFWT